MISFLLNNKLVEIEQVKADLTLLEYLREDKKLTGTKEGCASGDCGACTVVVAEITTEDNTEKLHYKAINSCVTFLSALQNKQLITVEHLSNGNKLHPVQQSMVDHHGSQCGFCTPGFIMSMFALYQQIGEPDREQVNNALSGNLCRCTGYRPIIDATLTACKNKEMDKFGQSEAETISQLKSITNKTTGTEKLIIPRSREELAAAVHQYPQARIFAGSTDLALQVTQQLDSFEHLIALTSVKELNKLTKTKQGLLIGSAMPFGAIESELLAHFPELSELVSRFASTPIRNQASLGGNVANASPIGDMPPALIALNASIYIDDGNTRRIVPISEFFLDYRKTVLKKGEWIESIYIPYAAHNDNLRAYKVSKRYEDDISAVCAVFNITVSNGVIEHLSSGFGGVSAIPDTAKELNKQMIGKAWADSATYKLGRDILADTFSPIGDVRASKEYRNTMLVNLWKRFWLETNHDSQVIETRVVHIPTNTKEASHA